MGGEGQGEVVAPGWGDDLDADGEAVGGGAAADHGAGPAGQAPGGGPADGVAELGGLGGPVGWGRAVVDRGEHRVPAGHPGAQLGPVAVPAAQQAVELLAAHPGAVGTPDLDGEGVAVPWWPGLLDGRPGAGEGLGRPRSTVAVVSGVGPGDPAPGVDRHPQALDPDGGRVARGHRGDPAVAAVGPGQHPKEQGQVLDRAGDRARLGPGVAEGADRPVVVEDPGDRDQPVGRLEGGHPAEVGRHPQAAAGVGAEAARRQGGRHRRGLAAAAASRGPGPVIGVVGPAVERVVGLKAAAPGRAVGLAEQDPPGRPQPGHRGGVGRRDRPGPLRHPDGGDHAPGLEVVLGGEGHAVQRAGLLAPGQGLVGRPCPVHARPGPAGRPR